jgi:glycosyltransferase involved in cell wall biosynthesis
MTARFTVLLSVHRPPALLPFAIESVLAQSHRNFELLVICDGAPPETAACARSFAARDARVRVFEFTKGERLGEAHRHTALKDASGTYIAHIADDDLWLPDHLTELGLLLADVEFGNLVQVDVAPDRRMRARLEDLSAPQTRQRMLAERWNMFGPTVAGYRLSTYRRLPDGWTPAPPKIWTDLHMWRKFLRLEPLSTATRFAFESLRFPSKQRAGISIDDRAAETRRWAERLRDPNGVRSVRAEIMQQLAANGAPAV